MTPSCRSNIQREKHHEGWHILNIQVSIDFQQLLYQHYCGPNKQDVGNTSQTIYKRHMQVWFWKLSLYNIIYMPTSSASTSCLWANEGNSSDLLGALDAATTPGSRHLAVKKSNKNSEQCSLLPHFHLTLWCCYISVYQYTAYNLPLIPATSCLIWGCRTRAGTEHMGETPWRSQW